MKAIGHLLGLGSSFARSLSIGSCTVTADEFDSGMSRQPGYQGLSLAVRQQLHNAMSLQINQDGAIGLPLADRPIVHSKHAWGRSIGQGSTAKQAQEGMDAYRHLHVFTLTSRRSASQFFGDGTEPAGLSARATR